MANPVLARALDILFILHADHEQNCSTNTMRAVGSSQADPYCRMAAAAAALSGPLHGGANEEVLEDAGRNRFQGQHSCLHQAGQRGKGKLMGFGHRVYKNYDPRARIIKWTADQVFKVTGRNPKLEIAIELERIALDDEYFVKRKLYPNVDFYSGIIYQAMGFRPESSPSCSPSRARSAGWRNGRKCSRIRSRRSPVRARSIRVTKNGIWSRWTSVFCRQRPPDPASGALSIDVMTRVGGPQAGRPVGSCARRRWAVLPGRAISPAPVAAADRDRKAGRKKSVWSLVLVCPRSPTGPSTAGVGVSPCCVPSA